MESTNFILLQSFPHLQLAFRRYRCDRCAEIFQTNSHSWWLDSGAELRCPICKEIQSYSHWDNLVKLKQRCSEPQGRSELYKAFAALSIWLLDYNNLKMDIAESLVSEIFSAWLKGIPTNFTIHIPNDTSLTL